MRVASFLAQAKAVVRGARELSWKKPRCKTSPLLRLFLNIASAANVAALRRRPSASALRTRGERSAESAAAAGVATAAACSVLRFFKRGCRASRRRPAASTPRPPTAPLRWTSRRRSAAPPLRCRVSAAGSARTHTHHTARSTQHASRTHRARAIRQRHPRLPSGDCNHMV